MAFTDKDIENLRKHGIVHLFGGPPLNDLLDRLEAAEHCIRAECDCGPESDLEDCAERKAFNAWRSASGK